MNHDKVFGLNNDFVFVMSPQLGRLGPKSHEILVSFCLGEGETLPQLQLRDLHIRSKFFLL